MHYALLRECGVTLLHIPFNVPKVLGTLRTVLVWIANTSPLYGASCCTSEALTTPLKGEGYQDEIVEVQQKRAHRIHLHHLLQR
jgi:hypothetical protein